MRSPRVWPAMVRGGKGLAQTYVDGLWDSPDLAAVIEVAARNMHGIDRMRRRLRPLMAPFARARAQHAGELARGHLRALRPRQRAVRADARPDDDVLGRDLRAARHERSRRRRWPSSSGSARKLDLQPSDHLLEIGTGWGGLALYAASTRGCRVTTTTLSREQRALALERVREAGLEDRVTVLLDDYRELTGEYDKLVSIEMIEAVGWKDFGTFFERCSALLRPDGVMALQAITIDDRLYDIEKATRSFMNTLIFPNGCLPSLEVIARHVARDGDLRMVDLEDITPHYAETLRRWRANLDTQWETLAQHGYDERFRRLWTLYLCFCEAGFTERRIANVQLVLAKPRWRGHLAAGPGAGGSRRGQRRAGGGVGMNRVKVAALAVFGARIAYGAGLVLAPTKLGTPWIGPVGRLRPDAGPAARGRRARDHPARGRRGRRAARGRPDPVVARLARGRRQRHRVHSGVGVVAAVGERGQDRRRGGGVGRAHRGGAGWSAARLVGESGAGDTHAPGLARAAGGGKAAAAAAEARAGTSGEAGAPPAGADARDAADAASRAVGAGSAGAPGAASRRAAGAPPAGADARGAADATSPAAAAGSATAAGADSRGAAGAIAYSRAGAGEPLLLLHTLGTDRHMWDPVLARLTAERDVIAIDMPGFGESAPLPGARVSPEALAGAIAAFLTELGIDRPHVAGNSLGGWIALELARTGHARSVTAIAPAGLWREPLVPKRSTARLLARALLPLMPALVRSARGRRAALSGTMAHAERIPPRRGARLRARVRPRARLRGRQRRHARLALHRARRDRGPAHAGVVRARPPRRPPGLRARQRARADAARLRPHAHVGRSRAGRRRAAGLGVTASRPSARASSRGGFAWRVVAARRDLTPGGRSAD